MVKGGPTRVEICTACLVALVAAGLAWFSVRPYASSWNDGSRLATVECLVEEHTLAIDHSVFVDVPRPPHLAPYPASEPALLEHGTGDKLFIKGHYYSDKSPVPAVLLAVPYQLWQWTTGGTARTDPDSFCWVVTLLSSGVAYVLAVLAIYRLGGELGLALWQRLLLTASCALATVALPYARQVNNHILLLAVVAWLVVDVAGLANDKRAGGLLGRRIWRLGCLSGLAYTIDLGAGPIFLVCTGLLVIACYRRWGAALSFALAALPCLALHHALNYAVGGSWRPANAIAEHFDWPGCPFRAGNMTGGWAHDSLGSFLLYAFSMLLGKRGFIGHNLPLFLVLPASWTLLYQWRKAPEIVWAAACCAGTWLLYAAASNNSSGLCLSIRWFVPLLAPGYFLIAMWLREYPKFWAHFGLLSGWGFLLMLGMGEGPWSAHMVRAYWPIQVGALVSFAYFYYFWNRKTARVPDPRSAQDALIRLETTRTMARGWSQPSYTADKPRTISAP
jgi:hypothetical protein